MAEIVNLRMARKARDRASAKARAKASRAFHGQTLAEREATRTDIARLDSTIRGAKRERSESEDS